MTAGKTVRGLGLISGGLDSMLAARLLMEQGIAVTGIAFVTPFFGSKNAEAAAARVGFPLIVRDITAPHLAMVKHPPSGYGRQMNPCIDCHALMLGVAGEVMDAEGFDFLFTGEVLNERPMSQSLRSLNRVANLSGPPGPRAAPALGAAAEGDGRRARGQGRPGAPAQPGGALAPAPVRAGPDVGHHRLPDAGRRLPAHRPGLLAPLQGPARARPGGRRARAGAAQDRSPVPHPRGRQGRGREERRPQPGAHGAARPRRPAAAHRRRPGPGGDRLRRRERGRRRASPPASARATATAATAQVRIIVESDAGERELLTDPIAQAELVARRIWPAKGWRGGEVSACGAERSPQRQDPAACTGSTLHGIDP